MAKWVVDVKGKPDSDSFEITVLRDDNEHGKLSYGWIGEDKLLISQSGGPCRDRINTKIWNKLLKVAEEVADELNTEQLES